MKAEYFDGKSRMDKDAADRISACPYHVSGNNRGSLDFSRSPGTGGKRNCIFSSSQVFLQVELPF